jgi:GNAT superfamily N-acetyltransferase
MEHEINRIQLSTGEWLDMAIVAGPESGRIAEITTFHDGHDGWVWSIDSVLRGKLPGVEGRFYTGRIDGHLVGDVAIYEHAGLGLFGMVSTEPRHRRKGISSALCEMAVNDFRHRGGVYMTLVAEYGSSAFRIYQRLGFREIAVEDGCMIWEAEAGAFTECFRPQVVHPQALAWRHWAGLCGFAMTSAAGTELRAWHRMLPLGPEFPFESYFLVAMQQLLRGELRAWVLEGDRSQPLGFAFLSQRWPQAEEWTLDLWVYPGYWEQAGALLEALGPLPKSTRIYTDNQPERQALLQAAGFWEWARLERGWLTEQNPLVIMRNSQ